LPAGAYRLVGFDPRITIVLDGSWQALDQSSGYASVTQLQRPPGSNPYRAGTLVQITQVSGVPTAAGGWSPPGTPEEAVAAIERSLGAMVIEASESRIGGLQGRQLTVERPGVGPPMSRDVVEVLAIANGSIVLFPGTRLWLAFFQQAHGVVAIVVNSSIQNWEAELAAAEPVLEQIRFEPS
jgi:hypothetical protein